MRKNNEQTDNTKYIIITLKNDITKILLQKKNASPNFYIGGDDSRL